MTKIDIKELEPLVKGDFQSALLKASFDNLNDKTNKLRLNNFAYSIRELSRHILHSLSPEDEIRKCDWFKNESGDPKVITRGERIKYAIQGGLTDKFLDKEIMDISTLNKLKKQVVQSITKLSKYTHINDDTFDLDDTEVDTFADEILGSFKEFHTAIKECRESIFRALDSKIDSEFVEHIYESTFDEIDILSTHHNIESYSTSSIHVTALSSGSIEMEVYGSVDVRLQYGSNSDLRRGEGAEMHTSFPFTSSLNAKLNDKLPNSELTITNFEVDTDGWYE